MREWVGGEYMRTARDILAESNAILTELLTCQFGIPYLDDALLGMSPGEVTLFGAKSGGGKTEAATQIILEQQDFEKKKCKSVLYFALDHEKGEIEKRVLWRLIVDQIKITNDPKFHGIPLRYAQWRKGLYREKVLPYEGDGALYLKHLFALSETQFLYRKGEMTAKDIASIILSSTNEFNLYVIDHFHSIRGIEKLEAQAEAISIISQATEKVERPVLILGQFRKSLPNKCPLPAMEEFSGSSQLVYQPNNIIVMGPRHTDTPNKYETYFQVVKSRTASDSKPFVGIHSFNIETKKYSEKYRVAKFNPLSEPELIEDVNLIPRWATRAVGSHQPISMTHKADKQWWNDTYRR